MTIFYIIIGIVVFVFIRGIISGNSLAKKHGKAIELLSYVLKRLTQEFPDNQKIVENDARVKYRFKSKSFVFTTDFIYQTGGVQVTTTLKSILGNKHRVVVCPYDREAILKKVFELYFDMLGFPQDEIKKALAEMEERYAQNPR